MKTEKIEKIENIHDIFSSIRTESKTVAIFRGQSNSKWKLIPKCQREGFTKEQDIYYFENWKRRAKAFLDKEIFTDTELLAIAQHTGLATRLLDWSLNPLVALFFACEANLNDDGAVYCLTDQEKETYVRDLVNPFSINDDFLIIQPNTPINRIANQHSYFTVKKDITRPFEDVFRKNTLKKFIIPKDLKNEILIMLNQYGINNLSIYPDLEGLSKHLNWFYSNPLLKREGI
ncbi:hypothetical protein AV926_14235 [Myroides marinus]|uniref:FRG domain-containing protein n=1 Tax=Myroides marinus TaxID=703342 RepID=A0A163X9A3_9FLAO|nr:FRG domain-containing protein [Myroides marinus]KZE77526.1 hypothetical protein AV926_14235 [Myroides marinus]